MDLPGLPVKSIHHGDTEFIEGVNVLRVLSASVVNIPDSFHHRDTEFAEFRIFPNEKTPLSAPSAPQR